MLQMGQLSVMSPSQHISHYVLFEAPSCKALCVSCPARGLVVSPSRTRTTACWRCCSFQDVPAVGLLL